MLSLFLFEIWEIVKTARAESQITYCIEYCLLKSIKANITKNELSSKFGICFSLIRNKVTIRKIVMFKI